MPDFTMLEPCRLGTDQWNILILAGSLVAAECDADGNLPSTVRSAKWAFSVAPRLGWGAPLAQQQSTAGWLASLPVFEPHWQAGFCLRLSLMNSARFSGIPALRLCFAHQCLLVPVP